MSVIFTESFTRYQRRASVAGAEVNDDLVAGGLSVASYYSNTSAPPGLPSVNGPGLAVAADPVYASRNCLTVDARTPVAGQGARVGFPFTTPRSHYIFGFRVRVGRSSPAGSALLFIGPESLSKASSTASTLVGASPSDPWMALLRIDLFTGAVETGVSGSYVASSYTYTEDSDIFLEVEIDTDDNLVRVWADDLLIVDSAFGVGVLAAAKAVYDSGPGIMVGRYGSTTLPIASIRDVYCLEVDAVAPFLRLGPTTQVIGEVPTDDADVDFTRPGGYASNAEVAALPVVPSPPDFLTADQVGQTDFYGVTGSEVAAAASQVYAIGVKTQVANFAAAAHTIGAVVRSGVVPVTGTEPLGAVSPGTGYVNRSAYFAENPDTLAAWTPQEAADAEFGLTVLS